MVSLIHFNSTLFPTKWANVLNLSPCSWLMCAAVLKPSQSPNNKYKSFMLTHDKIIVGVNELLRSCMELQKLATNSLSFARTKRLPWLKSSKPLMFFNLLTSWHYLQFFPNTTAESFVPELLQIVLCVSVYFLDCGKGVHSPGVSHPFLFFFDSGQCFGRHSEQSSQVFYDPIPEGLAVPAFNPLQGRAEP